ncbi:MAG: AAA family ATPase [Acidobacteria bacterium]|nr:AAA family ATPase [Acidobacteriota bacterium]
MAAISSLTIEGFKSFRRLERLELGPLNVLIGANGSGKSNFLAALELLAKACSAGQLSRHVAEAAGASRLLHHGPGVTPSMRFKVSFEDGQADFALFLRHGAEDRLVPSVVVSTGSLPREFAEQLEPEPGLAPAIEFLRLRLDRWQTYHFADTSRASRMKATQDLDDNRGLRSGGANLAAFLFVLQKKHKVAYEQIRKTVQLAAPFFDDFVLEPRALNPDTILLEWRHLRSDARFGASSLSDGSLRFIALATLLLQPVELRPTVIAIDEPELGLHPYAVTLLAGMLREASVESQIIVATQSPLLLDHFEPEEVLVTDRRGGATSIRPLCAEDLSAWLEEYSLGELWDKNELGGRPAPEAADGRSSG